MRKRWTLFYRRNFAHDQNSILDIHVCMPEFDDVWALIFCFADSGRRGWDIGVILCQNVSF